VRRSALLVTIAVVALALGAAVAGRPRDVASDVVSTRLRVPAATTTSTTARATSTVAPVTTVLTSKVATASSAPASSAGSTAGLMAVSDVRLIVANATNIEGLADRTIDELRPLGYVDLVAVDVAADRADTLIVYSAGRRGEALRLATQIGVEPASVVSREATGVEVRGRKGDVWLFVGRDRA
jgi:LytR cell envelope-related transcriptional attenuator